jgi:hypothetical protein
MQATSSSRGLPDIYCSPAARRALQTPQHASRPDAGTSGYVNTGRLRRQLEPLPRQQLPSTVLLLPDLEGADPGGRLLAG